MMTRNGLALVRTGSSVTIDTASLTVTITATEAPTITPVTTLEPTATATPWRRLSYVNTYIHRNANHYRNIYAYRNIHDCTHYDIASQHRALRRICLSIRPVRAIASRPRRAQRQPVPHRRRRSPTSSMAILSKVTTQVGRNI
ncbi:MAG: hypothetical protein R3C44_22320 [Chloroflexota bacterium]